MARRPALAHMAALLLSGDRAVVLRYIEGLGVAEAAAALRCSECTVKSQSARGLERLREVFPQHAHNFA